MLVLAKEDRSLPMSFVGVISSDGLYGQQTRSSKGRISDVRFARHAHQADS